MVVGFFLPSPTPNHTLIGTTFCLRHVTGSLNDSRALAVFAKAFCHTLLCHAIVLTYLLGDLLQRI